MKLSTIMYTCTCMYITILVFYLVLHISVAIETQSHDNHLTISTILQTQIYIFVATETLKMTYMVETCRYLWHDHVIAYILNRLYSYAGEINNCYCMKSSTWPLPQTYRQIDSHLPWEISSRQRIHPKAAQSKHSWIRNTLHFTVLNP
jgi:hypothetical protein